MPVAPIDLKACKGINVRAAAKGEPSAAEVYVYDEISNNPYWGVSAKSFADQIAQLDVDVLNVYVNSPGGSAWDGVAIMNALRRHRATVNVSVDGLAASAASVIVMAGDHVSMNRGAELMIHEAWSYASGNADELRQAADVLDKLGESIAQTYAARAGGDAAEWRAAMQAETWYTAEEAVLAGLADEWVDAPAVEAHFDLDRFSHAGRGAAPAPAMKLPDSSEPGEPQQKGDVMPQKNVEDILAAGLRDRLGVTDADASAESLLEALDELLTAPTTPQAALPAGTTLIDEAVLAELQSQAARGAQAQDTLDRSRREAVVAAALADGRIAPASRDSWLAQLERDEEGVTVLLNSMPKNTIPVAEIGHGVERTEDDALYALAFGEKKED